MSRSGITYEDVSNAAEELVINGDKPTAERVRNFLQTGSYTTIAKHLTAWREHRLADLLKDKASKTTTPDPVNQAVQSVWDSITKQKEIELTALKQENALHIENLEHANQILKNQLAELTEQLQDSSNKLEDSLKQYTNLKITHSSLEEKLAMQALQLQEREHSFSKLEQQQTKNIQELQQQYQKQLDDLNASLNKARDKMEEYRTNNMSKITNLEIKLQELEKKYLSEQKNTKSLTKELQSYKEQIKFKNTALSEVKQKLLITEQQGLALNKINHDKYHINLSLMQEVMIEQKKLQLELEQKIKSLAKLKSYQQDVTHIS